jgi:hypothetical protein
MRKAFQTHGENPQALAEVTRRHGMTSLAIPEIPAE